MDCNLNFSLFCPSLNNTTCLFQAPKNFTWSDEMDFQSSSLECSLTLATVCSNDTAMDAFSVSVHYELHGNHSTESLYVVVYGLNIVLSKNGVWVNRMQVSPPACLLPGKLQIRLEGHDLILNTLYGLIIKYDHYGFILIQLPSDYQSSVCGQCAQKEPLETKIKFVSEIAKNDSKRQCLIGASKQPWTSNEDQSTSSKYCNLFLMDDGPFSECHRIVNSDRFYDACQVHVCQELQGGANGENSACHDLEEYVTVCQLQDVKIRPWRNENFCPFACPPQATYELCTRTCDQCPNGTCSGPCQEGCSCPEGYVWNRVTCVTSNMCTKSIHPVLPKYLNCDPDSPSQSDCQVCIVNYHQILTFGNLSSPLDGNGVYDILRKCDSSAPQWLRVALHLQPQPTKLYFFYEESFITIDSALNVWVNGQLEMLPVTLEPELYISKAADVVVLGQPGTIDISFSSAGDLEIKAAKSLLTEMCGACVFGNLFPNHSPKFSLESWRAEDLS
ncbi:hypothetical protein PRIEUP_LOCUS14774 [Pristimantis euphronides]